MRSIVFGISAWGSHLDTFFQYGLPSLMARGNLPELAKKYQVIFNFHTDNAGYERLLHSSFPFLWQAKNEVTNEDKYTQLGRHQNDDLRYAKSSGADYHLCMPDYVYSENCFRGILSAVERGHKAIARLVVSTAQEAITPFLSRSRSAIELATLSLVHMHPGVKHWLVPPDGMPNNHVMVWVGPYGLHMCSPHLSPVFIANDAIRLGDSDLPLDCILDKVVDGPIYCPKPDDGIVIIELSPKDSRVPNDDPVDLKEFCRIMRVNTKNSSKQLEIFEQETIDPINGDMIDDEWGVDISDQKAIVMKALRGEYALERKDF